MSNIEWTERSWNPVTGCSRKSAGCEHCYAETMTKRLAAMGPAKYQGLLNAQDRFNGVLKFHDDALLIPLKTKKPTMWFVNSMSDLFHENMKDEWIDKVFAVMALCPQHTFQILTKRPERMRDYVQKGPLQLFGLVDQLAYEHKITKSMNDWETDAPIIWPLPNVWLGVSTEDQKTADERRPLLLQTPAAVRWISAEPLLGPIDLQLYLEPYLYGNPEGNRLDWVVVGGESGTGARPCNIEWIRSIVGQCRDAEVPVFVKQLGADPFYSIYDEPSKEADFLRWLFPGPVEWSGHAIGTGRPILKSRKGGDISEFPQDLQIREYPK